MAAVSPPDDTQLSPAESLEKVQKFLQEKNGQALSEWETRGLLTFLEKNVQRGFKHGMALISELLTCTSR